MEHPRREYYVLKRYDYNEPVYNIKYEEWKVVGKTNAVSEKQAINNVRHNVLGDETSQYIGDKIERWKALPRLDALDFINAFEKIKDEYNTLLAIRKAEFLEKRLQECLQEIRKLELEAQGISIQLKELGL